MFLSEGHAIFCERLEKNTESASAGNRTRVTSMGAMYSTTRPSMQLVKLASGQFICTDVPTQGGALLQSVSPLSPSWFWQDKETISQPAALLPRWRDVMELGGPMRRRGRSGAASVLVAHPKVVSSSPTSAAGN